jgi:hypothetical protein
MTASVSFKYRNIYRADLLNIGKRPCRSSIRPIRVPTAALAVAHAPSRVPGDGGKLRQQRWQNGWRVLAGRAREIAEYLEATSSATT